MKYFKVIVVAICLILIAILGVIYMLESNPSNQQNTEAINAATQELVKRNIPVEGYDVRVTQSGDSMVVVFSSPSQEPDRLGSAPGQPSFEVELSTDLKPKRISVSR